MKHFRSIGSVCLVACLAACSLLPPRPQPQTAAAPAQWQAALPHDGSLTELKAWWAQLDDPLLLDLIDAAQRVSPTVAATATRIAQAESSLTDAQAGLLPNLTGVADAARSSAQPPVIPVNTTLDIGVRSAWELDLFGARHAARGAGRANLAGARAAWHDARISVAADVANLYYSERACDKLAALQRSDAASRAASARLAQRVAAAGLGTSATAAEAESGAAESRQRATQQQAQCTRDIKALVALTAFDEASLRARLLEARTSLLPAHAFALNSVPAAVLEQRPDVYAAAQAQNAASFEVRGADAARYPRLTLNGAVGRERFSGAGFTTTLNSWSIGPLSLSVPLFDGGSSKAALHLAKVRYAEASSRYRASVRDAVRQVEQALVDLNSTEAQRRDAQTALDGYRAALRAAERKFAAGLGNQFDVEAARRAEFASASALTTLEQQRMLAWIALYRAVGGGWSPPETSFNLKTAVDRLPPS